MEKCQVSGCVLRVGKSSGTISSISPDRLTSGNKGWLIIIICTGAHIFYLIIIKKEMQIKSQNGISKIALELSIKSN